MSPYPAYMLSICAAIQAALDRADVVAALAAHERGRKTVRVREGCRRAPCQVRDCTKRERFRDARTCVDHAIRFEFGRSKRLNRQRRLSTAARVSAALEILDAASPKQLADITGIQRFVVARSLTLLAQRGLVRRIAHGVYGRAA